jgi:hypothetical protein
LKTLLSLFVASLGLNAAYAEYPSTSVSFGDNQSLISFQDSDVRCTIHVQYQETGGISCTKSGKFKNIKAIGFKVFSLPDQVKAQRIPVDGKICYAAAQYQKPGGVFCFSE